MAESSNRVDLGNVKGKQGKTGLGISQIVELPPDNNNLKKNFRIYFTDSTNENPHYFDYSLTDIEMIVRLNEMSVGNPSSDKSYIPTMYLLKSELNKRPTNTDVYLQNQLYTKSETENLIASAIGELELIIPVVSLEDVDEPLESRLYMVTGDLTNPNEINSTFDLFIYMDDDWVQLDSLNFSIANYYTKAQIDNMINSFGDTSMISNNLNDDAHSTTKAPSVNAIKEYVDDLVGDIYDYIES